MADAGTNVPVDPLGDIETIDLELIMADLEMVNRRVEKASKAAKGDKKFLREAEVFRALAEHLDAGKSARTFDCDQDDRAIIETADLGASRLRTETAAIAAVAAVYFHFTK